MRLQASIGKIRVTVLVVVLVTLVVSVVVFGGFFTAWFTAPRAQLPDGAHVVRIFYEKKLY